MVREYFEPALYKALRYGLSSDMHEPPLIKQIIVEIHLAGLNVKKDVLSPGHQKPHDGALLFGDDS